jgi:integrase
VVVPNSKGGRARNGAGSVTYVAARNRWCARIRVGAEIIKRYGLTQADAVASMEAAVAKLKDGEELPSRDERSYTVAQMLRDWLANHKLTAGRGGIEHRTYEFYEQICRTHLIPRIGTIPVLKLNAKQVKAMMADVLDKPGRSSTRIAPGGRIVKTGGRPGGSADRANRCRLVLHVALSDFIREGTIPALRVNVVDNVKKLNWESVEKRPLERHEAAKVIAKLVGHRLEGLALLVMGTGMREGEALGLLPENIDLEQRWVRVRTALSYDREARSFYLKLLKTRQSKRDLRIPEFVIPALERWLLLQEAEREHHGTQWCNEFGLFFTAEKGGPLSTSTVVRQWRQVQDAAGIQPRDFYTLRHGVCSYLADQGHNVTDIQQQLGWSNLAMVMRYKHLLQGANAKTAATLDSYLGEFTTPAEPSRN